MEPRQLLDLMIHIRVWLPKDSFIRNEVTHLIGQLRQQLNMPPELTE
jgi:hypothetical protein